MIDAGEYGRALFLLSEEDGITELILQDLECLRAVISDTPDYLKLLDTPAIDAEEKIKLADTALSGLHPHLCSLVKILTEKRCAYLLPRIAASFRREYDEARGIERVEAVSAVAMTERQTSLLSEKLAKITGKQIIITNTVDPSILGGIKLRYGGIQLDGSVKTRLDGFARSLRDTVI